jgi:hypothetical protein
MSLKRRVVFNKPELGDENREMIRYIENVFRSI